MVEGVGVWWECGGSVVGVWWECGGSVVRVCIVRYLADCVQVD